MTTATKLPAFTHEPKALTLADVQAIASGIGWMAAAILGVADIDLAAGRGRISTTCVCVWRRDGRRITVECAAAIVADVSNDPDPDYPRRQA